MVHPTSPWKYVLVSFLFYHCGRPSVVLDCIVDSMNFSRRWVFLLARTVHRLALFVSPSNWTIVSNTSWIRRWRSPQRTISYYLGSCYALLSYFFGATYAIALFIDSFLCVSNIFSDSFRNLSVWNGKIVFFIYCTAGCCFFCSKIHPICCCMSLFLLMLLSWITTLQYNCHERWTCAKEEPYFPHSTLQLFFPYYYLSFTPNLSWIREHLLWCIHTS